MDIANVIPQWAAKYIGLPYVAGGRELAGVDCWGLIVLIYREQFGIELPRYDGPLWDGSASRAKIAAAAQRQSELFTPVEPGAERLGDGVILRLAGVPLHVGLVLAPGIMLHAQEGSQSCIERYGSTYWKHRVVSFLRHGAPHA